MVIGSRAGTLCDHLGKALRKNFYKHSNVFSEVRVNFFYYLVEFFEVWIAKKAYQQNKETSPEGNNGQINIMTRVMIREQLNKERSAKTLPRKH